MGFSKNFEQRKSMLKSSQGFFECILISGSKRRKEVASTQNGSFATVIQAEARRFVYIRGSFECFINSCGFEVQEGNSICADNV